MAKKKRTAEDLAREAADCIESCGLRGDELRAYLAAWIADCAVHGDLAAMRRGRSLASARLDRAIRSEQ